MVDRDFAHFPKDWVATRTYVSRYKERTRGTQGKGHRAGILIYTAELTQCHHFGIVSMNIVRPSKLRHVYGEEQKQHFEEIRPSSLTSEGHIVKSNGSYVAFNWNIAGGGALCILSLSEYGRISPDHPLIKGHGANILDFDFNPFNDQQILTTCEDTFLRLWEFPPEGVTSDILEPLVTLRGHTRKAALASFNPTASYICASSGFDYTVKVWNVETATPNYSIGPYTETCLSINWDVSGQLIGSTWRDKKVRILDPRTERVAQEFVAHEGGKAAKFCWVNEATTCFTCGFSKQSERQMALWDVRQTAEPLNQTTIDQQAGVLMPFYDPDTGLLFLAGKGDGNIRYYEIVNTEPYIYFIESFKSTVPCQGVSFIPKRKVDVTKCEIMRAVKLTKASVELISFRVPRRAEGFQDDLYPDCVGMTPGCTASEWIEGANAPAPKIPMSTLMSASQVSEGIKGSFTPQSASHSSDSAELDRLRKDVEDLKSSLKATQEESTAHRLEAEMQTENLRMTQSALSIANSAVQGLQSEVQSLQSEVKGLQSEVYKLKESLSASEAKYFDLEVASDRRQKELGTALEVQIGALEEELAATKAELEAARITKPQDE